MSMRGDFAAHFSFFRRLFVKDLPMLQNTAIIDKKFSGG